MTPAGAGPATENGHRGPHFAALSVLLISALAAVLIVAGAVLGKQDSAPPPAPAAATCEMLTSIATISPRAGSPVALALASYHLDKGVSPARIARAGRLEGAIPAGSHVWLLTSGRTDSYDSTEEHNPGDGRLYPVGEIQPSNGCWSLAPQSIGYPEALGITFDQYVVVVNASVDREFEDRAAWSARSGFSAIELGIRRAAVVAVFPIATTP